LRISCLQTNPKKSIDDALKEALELANLAIKSKAEFLFLPEFCGGLISDGAQYYPPNDKEEKHLFLNEFKKFCYKNSIWCLIGSIAIQSENNKIFNRSYIINNNGNIISKYDKIHMFDISINGEEHKESDTIEPGSKAVIANTKLGKIGHTICYDLRFPNLFRSLAINGAEIIVVPSAFTKKTGQAHWHILSRARAIENSSYVIAPCSVGTIEGGGDCFGHSLIIDPWGTVIADGGHERGIISSEIDVSNVHLTRKQLPSLKHDKLFNY